MVIPNTWLGDMGSINCHCHCHCHCQSVCAPGPARRWGARHAGVCPLSACLAMVHVACLVWPPTPRGRPSVTSYAYGLIGEQRCHCASLRVLTLAAKAMSQRPASTSPLCICQKEASDKSDISCKRAKCV